MLHPAVDRRFVATRILRRVLQEGEFVKTAFDAETSKLGPSDRAWLTEVIQGSLRWKGRLDFAIDSYCLKKKPTGWLRRLLEISAYQLIVLDRADPKAVIYETVEAVKTEEGETRAGFVNKILRQMAGQKEAWRGLAFPENGSDIERAKWASLPEWLWKTLVHERGVDWAKDFALASLERPKLWLQFKPGVAIPAWAEAGPVPGSAHPTQDDWLNSPEFQNGDCFVQNLASQRVAQEAVDQILLILKKPANEIRVLDLCASPGGKSAALAWRGFQVVACEKNQERIVTLRENVSRLHLNEKVRVISWDELENFNDFDCVWVDAPCTGTGTLRSHPEIRWNKNEKQVDELIRVQQDLIKTAKKALKPRGIFIYSVCSVLKREGELQENFHENYSITLSPQDGVEKMLGMDGFYFSLAKTT